MLWVLLVMGLVIWEYAINKRANINNSTVGAVTPSNDRPRHASAGVQVMFSVNTKYMIFILLESIKASTANGEVCRKAKVISIELTLLLLHHALHLSIYIFCFRSKLSQVLVSGFVVCVLCVGILCWHNVQSNCLLLSSKHARTWKSCDERDRQFTKELVCFTRHPWLMMAHGPLIWLTRPLPLTIVIMSALAFVCVCLCI